MFTIFTSGTSVDDDMPSPAHSGSDEPGGGDKGAYNHNVHISINRRIQMPPAFHFPEDQAPPSDLMGATGQQQDFSKVNYLDFFFFQLLGDLSP